MSILAAAPRGPSVEHLAVAGLLVLPDGASLDSVAWMSGAAVSAVDIGRALAECHQTLAGEHRRVAVDRGRSLLSFSEVTHAGDWSLRSALCRLAQPEPVRVGRILQSVRRLETVLHHAQQALERNGAYCLRPASLLVDSLDLAQADGPDRYPDVRTADIARLGESGLDVDELMSGYVTADHIEPVSNEERVALPLLAVAVRFEELAETLTAWANQGPVNRPVEAVDQACEDIEARLDALGVPHETGGPPRGGRSRRST